MFLFVYLLNTSVAKILPAEISLANLVQFLDERVLVLFLLVYLLR